jgi:hypothetical protein
MIMFKDIQIVKSFESNQYASIMHDRWGRTYNPPFNPFLEWGLASHGELCCRGRFGPCNYPEWVPYESVCFGISVGEMKKIVKEFGHLIVFA